MHLLLSLLTGCAPTERSEGDEPRVVLVTGGSSGIGLAVAIEAARRGHHLVLAARDETSLKEAAAECERSGAASATVVSVDVGFDDQVEACIEQVVQQHGRVDAVAHCAGVVAYGRIEEMPVEIFDGVLRTNLTGSANVARHIVPVLRRQGCGVLVLVGSVTGHLAAPSMTPYVVSKWGVRALARQLQIENRDVPDVHISYVAPGGVLTPIYEHAANYTRWPGRTPLPADSPERVARTVVELFDAPRDRTQVGRANGVMRLGFNVLPGVYDAIVGPVFRLAAVDRSHEQRPTEGNVEESQPERNQVHANRPGGVRTVADNARELFRSTVRGLR